MILLCGCATWTACSVHPAVRWIRFSSILLDTRCPCFLLSFQQSPFTGYHCVNFRVHLPYVHRYVILATQRKLGLMLQTRTKLLRLLITRPLSLDQYEYPLVLPLCGVACTLAGLCIVFVCKSAIRCIRCTSLTSSPSQCHDRLIQEKNLSECPPGIAPFRWSAV